MNKDLRLFLSQIVSKPHQVVALAPSSAALCQEMVAGLDPNKGPVIELGPGTGNITRAILGRGIAPQMLHSVEMNANFCTHLRESFAGVNVHHMSACDLDKLGLKNVQAVISGLPLLSMPIGVQRDILNGSFNSLAPEGSFVQFTYGPNPSVNTDLRKEMALSWTRSDKIWRNLPPARVYRFTRPMH